MAAYQLHRTLLKAYHYVMRHPGALPLLLVALVLAAILVSAAFRCGQSDEEEYSWVPRGPIARIVATR